MNAELLKHSVMLYRDFQHWARFCCISSIALTEAGWRSKGPSFDGVNRNLRGLSCSQNEGISVEEIFCRFSY